MVIDASITQLRNSRRYGKAVRGDALSIYDIIRARLSPPTPKADSQISPDPNQKKTRRVAGSSLSVFARSLCRDGLGLLLGLGVPQDIAAAPDRFDMMLTLGIFR